MKSAPFYSLTSLVLFSLGCGEEQNSTTQESVPRFTEEEEAGLEILSAFATELVTDQNFPPEDPYQPIGDQASFRARIIDTCPNIIEAEVMVSEFAYSIGQRSKETIAGERTNWVNPKIIRDLGTPDVKGHYEIEYEYTTLDGDSGAIPATLLAVDRTIEGNEVRLIVSTGRKQEPNKAEMATPRKPSD
jgi:hypothetical protein